MINPIRLRLIIEIFSYKCTSANIKETLFVPTNSLNA